MTSDDTFAALHDAAKEACGARLFTITVLDRAAGLARRAYSSHPVDYPVTGTKPMGSNDWTRKVLDRGETFVANKTEEFAPFFPDHALINQLGCDAAVNIPVTRCGQVMGTVNILDVANHFTPARIETLERLVADASPDLCPAFDAALLEDGS